MTYGTAEFDVGDFASREAADKNVYVKFYIRPKENEAKSAEEGRPIFEDKEYVEIRTPGNTTNVVQRPVTDMDRKRFPAAYRAFKEGNAEQITGTPLVEAPWITRSQVEELSYVHIRTVEQLANVSDDVCTRMPGLFKLKQRAQAMSEQAEKQAPFIRLQEENAELRNTLETVQRQLQEQAEIIATLKKPEPAAKKG